MRPEFMYRRLIPLWAAFDYFFYAFQELLSTFICGFVRTYKAIVDNLIAVTDRVAFVSIIFR